MTYWISKTHVKIEPNEMTREEALLLARELLVELGGPVSSGRNVEWTPERDALLKMLREKNTPIREISRRIFGDVSRVGSVSGRINRLRLPVSDAARKRGLASMAARRVA